MKITLLKEEFIKTSYSVDTILTTNKSLVVMGVYSIKNKLNNKTYVGSSKNIIQRWKQHIGLAKSALYKKKYKLNNALRKYAFENFEFKLLEEVSLEKDLQLKEQYWIDNLNSYKAGYNTSPTAGSCKDYIWTMENREKVSKISLEQALEIRRRRTKGISNKQLAKEFNLHRTTITRICLGVTWNKENSLTSQQLRLRPSKNPIIPTSMLERKLKKSKFSIKQIEEIRKRYSEGQSLVSLSKEHNCHRDSIKRIVSGKWFPELPMYQPSPTLKLRRSTETIKIIKNKIALGASPEDIYKEFGMSSCSYYELKRGKTWKNI